MPNDPVGVGPNRPTSNALPETMPPLHIILRTSLPAIAAAMLIAGCATTPPDRSFLNDAGNAIEQAARAGADDYSPLELRFARERLELAELQLGQDKPDQARRLADEAEIEAQLALARTRAARTRAELADRQRELEQLRDDLVAAFGEEILEP